MSRLFVNTVRSVQSPPSLVVFVAAEQGGWCQQVRWLSFSYCMRTYASIYQFAEEGYDVHQIEYPPLQPSDVSNVFQDIQNQINVDWALITYGLQLGDLPSLIPAAPGNLKACVHFCPSTEKVEELLLRYSNGQHVP